MKNASVFENDILETSLAFWRSAVLFSVLRLNLFEKLGETPLSPAEIARICGAEKTYVHRILRALSAMGILKRNDDRYYCPADTIARLAPGKDKNLSHFCRLMGEDFSNEIWTELPEIAKNGISVIPHIVDEKPVRSETFAMAMQNLALQGEAEALTGALDLKERRRLVDFGGGSGWYAIALCKKNPSLQACIVELPQTAALATEIIAENQLNGRIQVVSSDWNHNDFQEEFDVVLLSDVLYFPEEESRRLIEISQKAIEKGGIIAIRGYFLDHTDERLFPALFDINLMLHNREHRTYEIAEVQRWLDEAGFIEIEAEPLSELSYLITARKPAIQ